MKRSAISDEPNDATETASRDDDRGDAGPPRERSAAAKATSGTVLRGDRGEDECETVDERDLLVEVEPDGSTARRDEMQADPREARASTRRPKAPDLPDRCARGPSPAGDATVPPALPRTRANPSVPPPLPPVAKPSAAALRDMADAEPPRHSMPRPRTPRPGLPARPRRRDGGLSWGWAAALIGVGMGAYAAGTLGAREERVAHRVAVKPVAAASSPEAERATDERHAALGKGEDAASAPSPEPASTELARTPPSPDATRPAPHGGSSATSPLHAGTRAFPSAPAEPETTPVTPAAPARGFDADAARSTLARAGAKAASCTDPRGGEGAVSVTFLPSGSPVNVKMSGQYEGTAVASCVERIFRAGGVAPFEGTATTVFYTVRLPGDGKPIN